MDVHTLIAVVAFVSPHPTELIIDAVVAVLAILGLIAGGRAVAKSKALDAATAAADAWQRLAEANKQQVDDLTHRLNRAEENVTLLSHRIHELESLPDLSTVVKLVEGTRDIVHKESQASRVMLKEVLDALVAEKAAAGDAEAT